MCVLHAIKKVTCFQTIYSTKEPLLFLYVTPTTIIMHFGTATTEAFGASAVEMVNTCRISNENT